MKKSSKIWKIEKFGHQFRSGNLWTFTGGKGPLENSQLIYDTEMDCLLDIVTEPENHGLKVYKHQTVTTTEPFGEIVEYAPIQKQPHSSWDFDYYCYSKEEISKLLKESYKFLYTDAFYFKSQPHTVYHWVEAYLQ